MTNFKTTKSALKIMLAGVALSATAVTAVPAHAGPLSFIKKVVKREADRALEDMLGSGASQSAPATAAANGKGFRQEGGTTVGTADDVQAPQDENAVGLLLPAVQSVREAARPQRAKMSQNGTTVETANEVQAPQSPQRAKMSQNGTTVETANEVQAPQRPQRAKTSQNGTTVETASEVQAPRDPSATAGDDHSAGDEHEITYDIAAGV